MSGIIVFEPKTPFPEYKAKENICYCNRKDYTATINNNGIILCVRCLGVRKDE